MADDFSLEDILKEYSAKTDTAPDGKAAIVPDGSRDAGSETEKSAQSGSAASGREADVPKKDMEETLGLKIKLGIKPQPIEPAPAPVKESPVSDMSVTALVEKAVEGLEEAPAPKPEKAEEKTEVYQPETSEKSRKEQGVQNGQNVQSVQDSRKKAAEAEKKETAGKSGNTAMIQKIVDLKKKKSDKGKEGAAGVEPMSRPKPQDIEMGLTGKIIPETAQVDIPEEADEAEDREALKKKRQKRIEKFVLEEKEREEAQQDDDYTEGEYNSFDETSVVESEIYQIKSNIFLRAVILLITSAAAAYISVANDFSLPILKIFDRTTSPGGFAFTLTALALVACFVSYNVVFSGLKNLVTMKADCDSIAAVSIVAAVLSGIVILVDDELARTGNFHIYTAAAMLGLLFNALGKLMIISRTERNFKYVSGEYDKYAITMVDDEETALKFTKRSVNEYPCLAAMKKTEFVKDFIGNSYSPDVSDSYSKKFAPFMTLAAVLIAFLGMMLDKNASGTLGHAVAGLSILAGTLAICSSIAIMLVANLPLARASKKYLQSSAVMLGYSSVEEFCDTNSVLVGVEQLFPEGMVELVNLKAMSATMLEECILYAGSLACQAGSVLGSTFYKILKGRTDMLYPVESYIYEDDQGLSGWIENKRVLLGTRELMERHSIEGLPTIAKEREYSKGNVAVYLSVSGVVSALFIIRVKASVNVTKWLRELEKQNIKIIIRSVDAFVSLNLLSKLFGISPDSMSLLKYSDYKEYDRQTSYVPTMSASMLCSGHFQSLAMLITGAKKIQMLSLVGVTIQMASSILGAVIALIMAVLGSFSQLTASVVLCYELVWLLVTVIVQQLRKL